MVPIHGEWHRFASREEQLEYMRLWGLIPPKSKQLRPIMVVDGYLGAPEPCTVVGYKDQHWAVIELPDGYHAIFGEYLAELQPDAMQRLPRGMCFVEILQDYIVLDIETTGFSSKENEIIEFAAIRYSYGNETARYSTLVKPRNPIPLNITAITGITMDDVEDAPFIEDVTSDILHFIGDRPIVGHNGIRFDFPFISAHLNCVFDNPKIDTLTMAQKAFPLLPRHRLDYLKSALDLTDRPAHRALNDVLTTNEVLWACLAPRRHESAMHKAYLADKLSGLKKTVRSKRKTKAIPADNASQQNNQTSLFDDAGSYLQASIDESQVFDILKPNLLAVLEHNSVGADSIIAESCDKYTSISYLKPEQLDESGNPIKPRAAILAFRICARKGKYFFSVKDALLRYAPETAQGTAVPERGNTGYANIPFAPTVDGITAFSTMLEHALEATIDSCFAEYSCCSRVEQCSNEKRCISPHPHIASNCKYRKTMKSGRIFYGPNRNID